MSGRVVPFPNWEHKAHIESEAEMVSWAIWSHAIETRRYSMKEAAEFGRLLWREFQRSREVNNQPTGE